MIADDMAEALAFQWAEVDRFDTLREAFSAGFTAGAAHARRDWCYTTLRADKAGRVTVFEYLPTELCILRLVYPMSGSVAMLLANYTHLDLLAPNAPLWPGQCLTIRVEGCDDSVPLTLIMALTYPERRL